MFKCLYYFGNNINILVQIKTKHLLVMKTKEEY